MSSILSSKFMLMRHTKAVNALAFSPNGSMLLSGGNDSRIVLWNLSSGEMMQEICVPSTGFISCLTWVGVADREEHLFVFGASDGNIHLYERAEDHCPFNFSSISMAHAGAIESLAWDSIHRRLASVGDGEIQLWKLAQDSKSFVSLNVASEKQPYVARSVHFGDDGSTVLISYLESGFVFCYAIDPWDLRWKKKTNGRIGVSCLDGQQLLVSNLRDGVDRYMLPTMHLAQSYHHTIVVNMPMQVSVARESGWVLVGGDNGFVRVFDYQTGTLKGQLDHGNAGDLIVAVAAFEGAHGCTVATGSALDGHSSVKVWTRSTHVSPVVTTKSVARSSSSLKQIALCAIVCVLINVTMRFVPEDIPILTRSFTLYSHRSMGVSHVPADLLSYIHHGDGLTGRSSQATPDTHRRQHSPQLTHPNNPQDQDTSRVGVPLRPLQDKDTSHVDVSLGFPRNEDDTSFLPIPDILL